MRSSLRLFAFFLCNGTPDVDLLEGFGRWPEFRFGPDIEMVFAIFANVLEADEHGRTLDGGDAQYHAAQWVRSRCDPGYQVEPPFEAWETELRCRSMGRPHPARRPRRMGRFPPACPGLRRNSRPPARLGRVSGCDQEVARVRSLIQIIQARRWRPAR
ncbi:DUF7677 family protein [Streptomyces viridosporus]|uniref:DUF7677 family protein n=1 Tax=Streptomyces viridosporus TaxID=67581 RepID=UPI003D9EF355